jgi:hypothetical protein
MMKRFLPTFLLITLVLAIYPFIGMEDKKGGSVTGLPWQIEILPDGSTRVFGVIPGQSTLGEAAAQLGEDMELAVMVAKGETTGSLEMYYGQYRAGLLSAKLVLAADLNADSLRSFIENAADREVLESGARKYVLNEEDHARAFSAVIETIACIPAVNLDHDIIIKRFGEPGEVIQNESQVTHYLYPDKGLDVILSEEGKEVLQYVAPADFERLRAPLPEA